MLAPPMQSIASERLAAQQPPFSCVPFIGLCTVFRQRSRCDRMRCLHIPPIHSVRHSKDRRSLPIMAGALLGATVGLAANSAGVAIGEATVEFAAI